MIRAASLCSGIGAPECALPDWEWIWCAEIEPAPCAVLAARFPETVNLGDITAADFIERALAVGMPHVLVAGTPCQDFSIAGLRAGLGGDRGNLTLRALQIWEGLCDAARSLRRPCPVFWWENVPGVLSDDTNAFGCLLGGLSGADTALVPGAGQRWTRAGVVDGPGRSVAWRTVDSQYFGLAQRRERVFVVASAGEVCAAEILLEFDGVRRDFAPRRGTGEEIAGTFSARTGAGGGSELTSSAMEDLLSGQYEVAHTLSAARGNASANAADLETYVVSTLAANGKAAGSATQQDAENGMLVVARSVAIRGREGGGTAELGDDLAGALRASQGGSDKPHVLAFGGNNTGGPIDIATAVRAKGGTGHGDFESETFLVQESFAFKASHFTRGKDGAPAAVAPSLSADADKGDQDTLVLAFDARQDPVSDEHIAGALGTSLPQAQAVAFHENQRAEVTLNDTAGSLNHGGGKPGQGYPAVLEGLVVRRLMPVETERLQGFPDGHTAVQFRGKPMADGPRYRAIGNSMSVPVMAWIGRRIERALMSNHGGIRGGDDR